MASRLVLAFALSALLFFSHSVLCKDSHPTDDDDEDLSFLEEPTDHGDAAPHNPDSDHYDEDNFDDLGNYSDFDEGGDHEDSYKQPEVDEKDVVVLKAANFSDAVEKNRFMMVEFYAPWCGHCQALNPEYAAAATELKGEDVVLAKVDATEENELSQEYGIEGFPTIFFFIDGVHKPYTGQRTKEGIVTWIKKKIGPGIQNVTTLEDAERILTAESKVVLGYLNSLVGPESDELAAASRLEDEVTFYQTVDPKVAKLFHLDAEVKRPALVLLKKEAEKLSFFDGKFDKSAIAEFVFANKLPLLLLFATSKDSEKVLPEFQKAAQLFKGKCVTGKGEADSGCSSSIVFFLLLIVIEITSFEGEGRLVLRKGGVMAVFGVLIFVYVETDNEDIGKPVSDYFGVTSEAPTTFGEDFIEDKLKPFYKSDPIPETNDGDVKIVVGNNFDDIVLDESKDVLLEIYAPWCGHCQSLEPTYNKLAKHLRGIESIVIAKMDGTTNEHPRGKADGFPTLLFFPAGNKSFDPIPVDCDRTVVAFYKFLKKNASIPFKLQKPASTPKSEGSAATESQGSSSSADDSKDEL
ncbi:hypothetical protein C1H46_043176 [Malus baccata]|uniref:Protein disulfide-isomerase n=1 Tax=Malus baccata TaxID=106549 RepID=A0A540KBH5_MALBA|nr:hypothetical protein C1H46_043176 [Malus baccata]